MIKNTPDTLNVLINHESNFKNKLLEALDKCNKQTDVILENDLNQLEKKISSDIFDLIIIDYRNYYVLNEENKELFDKENRFIIVITEYTKHEQIIQLENSSIDDFLIQDSDNIITIKRILRNVINKIEIIYEKNNTIKQLEDMKQKYNLFIEKSKDIPFFVNNKGILTYIGPQVENYGYRITHFLGKPFTDFIYEADREKVYRDYINNFDAKQETTDIFRVDTPKQGIVWFESKSRIIFDHNGEYLLGIGIIRDVNDRIEFKNKSEFNEIKYQKMFENATDAILIMKDDVFIECNKKSVEIYGARDMNYIIGKTPVDFSPVYQDDNKKSKEWAAKYISDSYNGREPVFDWKHITLKGDIIDCKVSLSKFSINNEDFLFAIVRKK
jgi:PAS domain S-box-containing protein